ncbi:MAG: hypothetical protein Ta2A_12960 [Treponemataceae bacterium]|nr:MAG: hypothetical protein Ta2A_12960 [Treponemataceae bacterium]
MIVLAKNAKVDIVKQTIRMSFNFSLLIMTPVIVRKINVPIAAIANNKFAMVFSQSRKFLSTKRFRCFFKLCLHCSVVLGECQYLVWGKN